MGWFPRRNRPEVVESYNESIETQFALFPVVKPVLEAERLRGNEPVGGWHKIRGQYPNEFWDELVLRFRTIGTLSAPSSSSTTWTCP